MSISWRARPQRSCLSPAPSAGAMQFWRPLPWKRMDVVCGEGAAEYPPTLQVHEALQVILPRSPVAVTVGGTTRVVDRDTIHFTAPLEAGAVAGVEGIQSSTRVLFVGSAMLSRMGGCRISTAGTLSAPRLTATFEQLFDELRGPAVEADCIARLIAALHALLTAPTDRTTAPIIPDGVLRARDHLRAHTNGHVTLDELAAVACLSKFYLLRAFHRALGLTPHEYQMQLRLARARRLLAEGWPLSHVTYDAGFADQSHLTRRFTAFYGMTPGRFARQVGEPFVPRDGRGRDVGWHAVPAPAA